MTWLSRLLPQSPSLQRLANDNHRTRQAQRRRRQATLETLEGRTLLSGMVSIPPVVNGLLVINLDSHSDNLNINENGGNTVTVTPLNHSFINSNAPGVAVKYFQINAIQVNVDSLAVPGTSQNSPVVSLTETAGVNSGIKAVAVEIYGTTLTSGPDLTLTVTGVKNTGAFSVQDYSNVSTSTYTGGTLSVTVTGSTFPSMNIEQFGCCQATVDLENDITTGHGAVSVSEGYYGAPKATDPTLQTLGDTITFHNDNFGSTQFTLGNGPQPTMPKGLSLAQQQDFLKHCCDNAYSQITGDDSNFKDLTIIEPNRGAYQSITVGSDVAGVISEVEVSDASFGIVACQGDGKYNSILIQSITTSGHPNNELAPTDSIITHQGCGNYDSTIVDSAQVFGNIKSFQGNGALDFVGYYGNVAGFFAGPIGPYILDFNGNACITQGDGKNDTVTLDCGIENFGAEQYFNNVYISQGSGSIYAAGCDQQTGDTINVNWTYITSNMWLEQGEYYGETSPLPTNSSDPGTELGSNFINIATTSPVYVGYSTVILETGEYNQNNTIIMGGIAGPDSGSIDFETGYLDVYTGLGGGAYVQVENTQVDYGALGIFTLLTSDGNPYNITGGGGGNSAGIDNFSSLTVSIDPAFSQGYPI